ncbi:MAG: DUF72 domain-containing protein [Bacteriovoracaceae bacterium]
MEFGYLDNIEHIDWTLPANDEKNSLRLTNKKPLQLYLGSPAWGVKEWIGKLYPPKTPTDQFLFYYSRNFSAIELNTTHYRIPNKKTALNWRKQVPANFHFCPKVTKEISHSEGGMRSTELLKSWLHFIETLGDNLGPCFIQFHEHFSYNEKETLFRFLQNWPSEFPLTIELRHPSWFKGHQILPALSDYLHHRKMGLVITDVAGRRDVLHSTLSSSWSMIRLIGNNLHPSDRQRLGYWAQRIKDWEQMGLEKCYLILHQPDDLLTIEFAQMCSGVLRENHFENVPAFTYTVEQLSF